MFQFPGFAFLAEYGAFNAMGCPIRTSADHVPFADPRSFSQLTTSFFASESLGIPHTLLLTSFNDVKCVSLRLHSPMCSFVTLFLYYSFINMSMNSLLDSSQTTSFKAAVPFCLYRAQATR